MYAAKRRRKGTYQLFEAPMREEMTQRLELRADLAEAIARGALTLHYQPIVDLHSGALVGVEALVRWPQPSVGLVAPSSFIPFAEETGLIIPLGQWVLGEACRQVRRWEIDTGHPLTVSVNLSPNQLHDGEFPSLVAEVLEQHRLDPERLVLEITETVLMQTSVEVLEDIKSLGVSLAIDDFGTGYSSLSYLDRLPIEIIKVDRSFVERVASGEPSPLARTIVQLGESLGLRTVVEGIETIEQLEALTALGVRVGQGFYLAKPMEADALEELLRKVDPGEPIVPTSGEADVLQLRPQKSA